MDNKKENRGGARAGAGRKKGVLIGPIKPATTRFNKRITFEEKEFLERCLDEYRKNSTKYEDM